MHIERERRRINGGGGGGGIGDYYYHVVDRPLLMESSSKPFPFSSSPPPPPLPPSYSPSAGGVGAGYIEHPVSKFDTLAGVAIKYGVEVADIKKMNGLVTDLQMFALKSLHIPLPGRHPPSPILLNGSESQGPSNSEQTPASSRHSDLFDSFGSLKLKSSSRRRASSDMCTLQPPDQKSTPPGFEMSMHWEGDGHHSNPPLSHHRKCKSLAYDLSLANGNLSKDLLLAEDTESEKWIEKPVRRRQKSEVDFNSPTAEKLLKDDSNSGASFSATAGKGAAALRIKAASRAAEAAEAGWPSNIGIGLWDSFVAASTSGVRKSLSTPSFQDSDGSGNSACSSIWPAASKWSSLKPDLQALSSAALARPIFDGLANNPITGRRNKTAVD
ncbi:hypothetical protein LguiA_000838 [Lonicera macranthoides]